MNLLLLRGHIGKPGAGPCPVRGHSNVQGDRTMGIWERMNDAFMDKLGKVFAFDPPKPHGVDAVECVKGMHRGEIQFFLGMGGNFLSGHVGHELHRRRAAEVPADGARFHQAQPLAPHHRRDGADPARARAARKRTTRRAACSS